MYCEINIYRKGTSIEVTSPTVVFPKTLHAAKQLQRNQQSIVDAISPGRYEVAVTIH